MVPTHTDMVLKIHLQKTSTAPPPLSRNVSSGRSDLAEEIREQAGGQV